MGKKPVREWSDEELSNASKLVATIFAQQIEHGKEPVLPARLEKERQEVLAKQQRRLTGIHGEGIWWAQEAQRERLQQRPEHERTSLR
jgi:hypothetical protein